MTQIAILALFTGSGSVANRRTNGNAAASERTNHGPQPSQWRHGCRAQLLAARNTICVCQLLSECGAIATNKSANNSFAGASRWWAVVSRSQWRCGPDDKAARAELIRYPTEVSAPIPPPVSVISLSWDYVWLNFGPCCRLLDRRTMGLLLSKLWNLFGNEGASQKPLFD